MALEVERNVSGLGRKSSARVQTQKAIGQESGDLGQAILRTHPGGR